MQQVANERGEEEQREDDCTHILEALPPRFVLYTEPDVTSVDHDGSVPWDCTREHNTESGQQQSTKDGQRPQHLPRYAIPYQATGHAVYYDITRSTLLYNIHMFKALTQIIVFTEDITEAQAAGMLGSGVKATIYSTLLKGDIVYQSVFNNTRDVKFDFTPQSPHATWAMACIWAPFPTIVDANDVHLYIDPWTVDNTGRIEGNGLRVAERWIGIVLFYMKVNIAGRGRTFAAVQWFSQSETEVVWRALARGSLNFVF